MVLRAFVVLAALAMLAFPRSVLAQEGQPTDDEVNAIAKGLYCPVCENVPLDVCPTQACKQWRDTIRQKLAIGWSQDQIEQYFVDQYGDRVLATPPATGLNWVVYLLPPIVFVFGAIVLAGAIRSWRRSFAAGESTLPDTQDDPYVQRLEEELHRRG